MNNDKVIVTGGLGFIGSNLIDLLIEKKIHVVNLDKVSYSSNFYNVKNYSNNKLYKFYKLDINNREKFLKILKKEKPSTIFNLAAETHVDRSIDSPYEFIKNNILGVFNILETLRFYNKKNAKIKLIHISTDEVYGDVLNGRSNEKYKYLPSSPYAASKAASDHLVSSYFKTYKIPVIVTNCSNNYGPKQHPEKLIPKLIYNIFNNKPLPIYGKGLNSREWIYVSDHCNALYKVYKNGKIGNFYNIGSNKNLKNIQVCKLLLQEAKNSINLGNKVKIEFIKDRPGHDKRYALNSNKIIKELKWSTKVSFSKGIKMTFKWYRDNKDYYKSIVKKDFTKRLGTK